MSSNRLYFLSSMRCSDQEQFGRLSLGWSQRPSCVHGDSTFERWNDSFRDRENAFDDRCSLCGAGKKDGEAVTMPGQNIVATDTRPESIADSANHGACGRLAEVHRAIFQTNKVQEHETKAVARAPATREFALE